jgi:MFS family permease
LRAGADALPDPRRFASRGGASSGAGSFLFGLGLALVPLGSTFAFATFTVVIWTVGEMMSFPMLGGWVARYAPDASRGRYMGLFTAAFSAAFVVAPFTGAWVYERWGPQALWYGVGVMGLLMWAGFQALSMALARRAAPAAAPAPEPAARG